MTMVIDLAARIAVGVAIAAVSVGVAWAEPPALGSSVESLLDHARGQSPELAAMRLEADAAAQCVRSAGLDVKVVEVHSAAVERKRLGVPERFGSCHTSTVDGYVLEGHVPADEVKRLIAARPKAIGLAVPSMSPGSPGMEMGARKDPYQVLLINSAGQASVYASYPK